MRFSRWAAAGALAVAATMANAAVWDTFVIRNAADTTSPTIQAAGAQYPGTAMEFITDKASQKAGWGTSELDGSTIGDILAISIERLDDTTRFAAGSGPAVAPYFNIWVTNGAGKYAVIANEPSNPEWQPGNQQWNMTWDTLKTKTCKVYETSDKSWLPNNGVGLTFEDIAAYAIQAPSVAELTTGWLGLGTGAPRELGTNVAYGFNWIFGDTLANYVSGDDGFVVNNPLVASASAVPEPGTLAMLSLAGAALLRRRRR